MIEVKGQWFDGISSNSTPAILSNDKEGMITIHANESQFTANLEQAEISSRLGSTPRRVRLDNGGLFETNDNDAIDLLVGKKTPWSNLIYRIESNLFLYLGGVLVIGMLSWWFITDGLPRTSNYIAHQLPNSITASLGEQLRTFLDYASFEQTKLTVDRQTEVRRLFTEIVQNSDMKGKHCRLEFYSAINSFGPNAFALPPCLIIATDEFIQIAENDNQISAVFAHEIGHIYHRHTLRRIVQNSIVSFAILLMSGDATQIPVDILSVSAIFMELNYSRSFENEADRFAHSYMVEHGIVLNSFPNILRRMESWRHKMNEVSVWSDECSSRTEEIVNNPGEHELEKVLCNGSETQTANRHEKREYDWPRYFSTHPDTEERALLFTK